MDEALSSRRELGVARIKELKHDPHRLTWKGTDFTQRRVDNFVLNNEEQRRGATLLESYPSKLTVESTNICNLRCTACPTGGGRIGRTRGHMSMELFTRLFDELGPYLFELELHNWGEPLLGKHFFEMVEMATRAGVSTVASTNFSVPFDEERAERLVTSGLTLLGVSVDGARQESYEQYRVRGDLDLVMKNCRLLVDAKRRLRSERPYMIWDFHVFSHNVQDVELARQTAAELGMGFVAFKGWVVGSDWDSDHKYSFFLNPQPDRCQFLWSQAVVHNDGGVAPCCGTFYQADDLGRIAIAPHDLDASRSFREVWNGENFQAARRLYESRAGATPELEKTICYHCPQTAVWERYKVHLANGGSATDFNVGVDTNECFNFFWNFREPGTTDVVPLKRKIDSVTAPTK